MLCAGQTLQHGLGPKGSGQGMDLLVDGPTHQLNDYITSQNLYNCQCFLHKISIKACINYILTLHNSHYRARKISRKIHPVISEEISWSWGPGFWDHGWPEVGIPTGKGYRPTACVVTSSSSSSSSSATTCVVTLWNKISTAMEISFILQNLCCCSQLRANWYKWPYQGDHDKSLNLLQQWWQYSHAFGFSENSTEISITASRKVNIWSITH